MIFRIFLKSYFAMLYQSQLRSEEKRDFDGALSMRIKRSTRERHCDFDFESEGSKALMTCNLHFYITVKQKKSDKA